MTLLVSIERSAVRELITAHITLEGLRPGVSIRVLKSKTYYSPNLSSASPNKVHCLKVRSRQRLPLSFIFVVPFLKCKRYV